MRVVLLLYLLAVATLAQAPKPVDPLEELRNAIKILESDPPPTTFGLTESAISRRIEKANAKMLELQKLAAAIELIKKAIAQIEAEKQRLRVVPTLPAP